MPARRPAKAYKPKPFQPDNSELTRLIVSALALCKTKGETKAADHLLEALRALHIERKDRKERP